MSLDLLFLFTAAMVAGILGRCLASGALFANLACFSLLAVFAALLRFRGVRRPVV